MSKEEQSLAEMRTAALAAFEDHNRDIRTNPEYRECDRKIRVSGKPLGSVGNAPKTNIKRAK